jgi:hypothetical protein
MLVGSHGGFEPALVPNRGGPSSFKQGPGCWDTHHRRSRRPWPERAGKAREGSEVVGSGCAAGGRCSGETAR